MAMFVLDKAHIDGLVHAGIRLGVIDVADANATGRILLDQHYRCLGFVNGSTPSDYTVQTASFLFHLVAILKLVDCCEYQASESRGWDKSPARAWSRHLRNEALRRLPDAATRAIRIAGIEYQMYETLGSWVDTPWGITSLDQIPGIGGGSIAIPATRKGFPINILTGPYGSCSNGGLSSRVRGVVIVEIDGDDVPDFARLTEPRQDAPAVSLRSEYGRHVARPADSPGRWFMASGAFLHSSDSRWAELVGHSLPIPLHDRTK